MLTEVTVFPQCGISTFTYVKDPNTSWITEDLKDLKKKSHTVYPLTVFIMLHLLCFLVGAGYTVLPQSLQKLRASMDKQRTHEEEEEEMAEDSDNSQLLRLMARHTQLKDLLHAHDIIGTHVIHPFIMYLIVRCLN